MCYLSYKVCPLYVQVAPPSRLFLSDCYALPSRLKLPHHHQCDVFVGPDLGPNCLHKLSADDIRRDKDLSHKRAA